MFLLLQLCHGIACVGEGFRSEQLHEKLQRPDREELSVPSGTGGCNRTQSCRLDLCQEVCCDDDDDDNYLVTMIIITMMMMIVIDGGDSK